jgi:hypothetical protein
MCSHVASNFPNWQLQSIHDGKLDSKFTFFLKKALYHLNGYRDTKQVTGAREICVLYSVPFHNVNIYFLLNWSNHNTNEICIITFNCALLHVPAPGSHHQAKYNKRIPNYRIACYIISALELDSYIHIQ